MIKNTLAILSLTVLLSSCTQLLDISKTIQEAQPLTETEIVSGLKEALRIGADSAAIGLSKLNGYYGDDLVRILLPPEAAIITQNIHRLPGGDRLLQDVILRINRAAEDAAREATPIFASVIRQMTITDGVNILRGEQDAATSFLKRNTYDQLTTLFAPKIRLSLDKELVGGISTNESWNALTSGWNRLATSMVGQVAGFTTVDVNLENYLTRRALDGMFLKLAEEEKKIRTDPMARVTGLLRRVFGQPNTGV